MRLLAFLILALASAPAVAQESDRSLSEAVDVAIDWCAASAFGTDAAIDGRIAVFVYAEGALGSALTSRGIQNTSNLPALIQRFIATSRHASVLGHSDVTAIATDDGMVWLVMTLEPGYCDIAVTGVDDASGIASSVSEGVTSNEGWSEVSINADDLTWAATFEFVAGTAENEPASASIVASGLTDEFAVADGIQAEINFAAVDTSLATHPEKQSK